MLSKPGPTVADHEGLPTMNGSFQPCTESVGRKRAASPGRYVCRCCELHLRYTAGDAHPLKGQSQLKCQCAVPNRLAGGCIMWLNKLCKMGIW